MHETWIRSLSQEDHVRSTFYEVLECLMDIQLRIQVAGNNIQHVRRFIASDGRLRAINIGSTLTFYLLNDTMLFICDDTISKLNVLTKASCQRLAQQSHIVLLQILIHVHTRYLYEKSPAVLVVILEDDWREPRSELLLRDVVLNQTKAVVPKRLWIIYLAALLNIFNLNLYLRQNNGLSCFRVQSSHFFFNYTNPYF